MMKNIVFTDDNGKLKHISEKFGNAEFLPFGREYSSNKPDAIMVGHISCVENAEKIKKYIIREKINGAFILINLDLGEDGNLFSFADNGMVKKMKELCLFANTVFLNYTEACSFTNLSYIEECEEKDVERLIFMLNSFGMANKIVITSVPVKDKGCVTVISEYGECEILEKDCVAEEKYLAAAFVLKEITDNEKIHDAVLNTFKRLYN